MHARGLFAIVAASALTFAAAHAAECTPRSVSVSGHGSASTVPGIYTFHASVSRRGSENEPGPRPLMMGARSESRGNDYLPGTITVQASLAARFALAPSGCPSQ